MNNRLKQFLAAENITQAQFADKINVVRASVSHILSGRNNPSFDFIKAMMSNYPNLNMDWLMFGKGKMYKDSLPAEADQLFPIEIPEPVIQKVEEDKQEVPHTEVKTLNKDSQYVVKQRKVMKVILMFDDGSYQEL